MRSLLIFTTLLFFSQAAYSQILNIERTRLNRDTARYWTGQLDLSFMAHNRSARPDNPVRFTNFSTNADVAYTSNRHRYFLINQISYSALTGNAFLRTGYSHFRANLHWRQTLSEEFFSQAQYDIGRGLKERYLAGAGLRLKFIDGNTATMALGVGLMYEQERWEYPEEERDVTVRMPKNSNYLSLRWQINPAVSLNAITYYQHGYDNQFDTWRHRFSGDFNMAAILSKRIRFTTTFNTSYDPTPIVPVMKWVYSLQNGIRFAF
jgi:hypothetical protein